MLSVTAGGPGLVAVGTDGHRDDSPPDQIDESAADAAVWTSVDGLEWSRVPHDEAIFGGPGEQRMISVTVGGPGLVAVGSALAYDEPAIWTSVDGWNWARVPYELDVESTASWWEGPMLSVTAAGPGLVAVGMTGAPSGQIWTEAVWTSPDGLAWSPSVRRSGPYDDDLVDWYEQMVSVTAGGPGLVAVGSEPTEEDGGEPDANAAVWVASLQD